MHLPQIAAASLIAEDTTAPGPTVPETGGGEAFLTVFDAAAPSAVPQPAGSEQRTKLDAALLSAVRHPVGSEMPASHLPGSAAQAGAQSLTGLGMVEANEASIAAWPSLAGPQPQAPELMGRRANGPALEQDSAPGLDPELEVHRDVTADTPEIAVSTGTLPAVIPVPVSIAPARDPAEPGAVPARTGGLLREPANPAIGTGSATGVIGAPGAAEPEAVSGPLRGSDAGLPDTQPKAPTAGVDKPDRTAPVVRGEADLDGASTPKVGADPIRPEHRMGAGQYGAPGASMEPPESIRTARASAMDQSPADPRRAEPPAAEPDGRPSKPATSPQAAAPVAAHPMRAAAAETAGAERAAATDDRETSEGSAPVSHDRTKPEPFGAQTHVASAQAGGTGPGLAAGSGGMVELATATGDGGAEQVLPEVEFGEIRAPARSSAGGALPILHAPDTPRMVALQIAEVVRASGERAVELRLQPEELGRVQLTMSQDATGTLTVALNVERPDTLDLLRRNIDLLSADLRELGYESIDFSFQGDGAGGEHLPDQAGGDAPAKRHNGGGATTDASAPTTPAGLAQAGDGIDMRL